MRTSNGRKCDLLFLFNSSQIMEESMNKNSTPTFENNFDFDNLSFVTTPIPDNWPDLNLTLGHWIAIIFSVVVVWILLAFILAYFMGPDFVRCYLCEKQVRGKKKRKLHNTNLNLLLSHCKMLVF